MKTNKKVIIAIILGMVTMFSIGLFSGTKIIHYDFEANYIKECELKYWNTKSQLVDEVQNYINTVAPTSDLRACALIDACEKYNIEVIGCTNHSFDGVRQKEILDWLSRNEDNVEDFIILDDEWQDLEVFTNKLILTSDATPNRPILGCWYCRDGLRFIHVIKSIKMLGIKNIKRRNNQNEQS